MISMTPVLTRGYTAWDRSLFPVDEFEARVRTVQARMRDEGIAALLIFSNTYHTNGDLAFLAGWPVGGALMALPEGQPKMFTFGGGREIFFQKNQVWLDDMSSIGPNYGPRLKAKLEEQGVVNGVVGVVGLDLLTPSGHAALMQALGGYELRAFDEVFHGLREAKRAREVLAVREALRIAAAASEAARAAYESGASNAKAVVEAERAARHEGALDYRGLANINGDDLRPYEGLSVERQPTLTLWSAVNYHGYWADMALDTAPPGVAAQVVEAMLGVVRAGVAAGEVAQAALNAAPKDALESALSYGLGGGIGLELDETPRIAPDSQAVLKVGSLISLRAFIKTSTGPSLAGALVQMREDGAVRLTPA